MKLIFLYNNYFSIFLFFLVSLLLGFIIIFMSYRFSLYMPDTEKVSAYECGFDPYEDARNCFDIRFYLVAILFIIFDLEAVYFFPWCISFSFLNIDTFYLMLDFIIELIVGFFYAWEVGALEWE